MSDAPPGAKPTLCTLAAKDSLASSRPGRKRGSCRRKMKKLTAWNFHDAPLQIPLSNQQQAGANGTNIEVVRFPGFFPAVGTDAAAEKQDFGTSR
jgi:hypothetical protein